MPSALHVDLYQLTSLAVHHADGRTDQPVTMSFFSRRLPQDEQGRPVRGYLVQAALSRCLGWLAEARLDGDQLESLQRQPVLGPRLSPELAARLQGWRFRGIIDAPLDGTPIVAGQAVDMAGEPVDIAGVRPAATCPFLVVQTDLLSAKLIETPLLSLLNHMTMVASKAARVVAAAGGRAVYEFGQRRTHPEAAVDAALAAWIAGVAGTSNVEAWHRHRIPCVGTMDHFAVQSWERPGVPVHETEAAFFRAFHQLYGGGVLLVDTYDTFGARTGIRNAVRATGGALSGIRLDSGITRESVRRARALLDAEGAPQAKIVLSGGMDEHSIADLGDAPADGFGIGERIVCSPDAPVGVGAVAKLCMVGRKPTMKLSRGSGKATLPGRPQVFRPDPDAPDAALGDVIGLAGERVAGRPLLARVWEGDAPTLHDEPDAARARLQREVAALPAALREPRPVRLRLSPGLRELVGVLIHEGTQGAEGAVGRADTEGGA